MKQPSEVEDGMSETERKTLGGVVVRKEVCGGTASSVQMKNKHKKHKNLSKRCVKCIKGKKV